jgi:LuxR family maltose regulon positive regulatory protein
MVILLQDDLMHGEQVVSSIDPNQKAASRFETFEFSAVANARGYRAMAEGNFDFALESLALGRALGERAGATFTSAYSIAKTALTYMAQGRLQEAVILLRSALADPDLYVDESVSETSLVCGLISALYETGDLDGAAALFEQFHDAIANAAIHDYLVIAYIAIARVHDANEQRKAALEVLDEAERIAYAAQWPRAVNLLNWERVRREVTVGGIDRAEVLAGWISENEAPKDLSWVRLSEETNGPVIGRIRLMIHGKEAPQALEEARRHLRQAEQDGRVHRQIKLNLLVAMARKRLGDTAAAHRALACALELAAPGGYLRCFLDEGEVLSGFLLEHIQATGNVRGSRDHSIDQFLERLVIANGDEPPAEDSPVKNAADEDLPLEPFTEREKKVLALVLDYLSNDEIAKAMFVTRDTVKYHLKNIYSKLAVNNRLDAIRIAKSLDWQ